MIKKLNKGQKAKRRARSKRSRSDIKISLKEVARIANFTNSDMEMISIVGKKVTME